MDDFFLDRLERQLVAAEQRLAPRRRRWKVEVTRRGTLIGVIIAAGAVPALAATKPWEPMLGRPSLHDRPHGTSETPVPQRARDLLAVLRRPQTSEDRGDTARRLLRVVGQSFSGVRPDSVRLLTLSRGHHALLVSSTGVGASPNRHASVREPLCLVWSAGAVCGTTTDLARRGITASTGRSVRGVVPDGVAKIAIRFTGAEARSVEVRDNAYLITDAPTEPGKSEQRGGAGSGGRGMTVTRGFQVRWFAADGRAIGPPLQK